MSSSSAHSNETPLAPAMPPFALLDDCSASGASPSTRCYTAFLRERRCDDPRTLDAVWAAVDEDIRAGAHVVVLADYEWGARLLGAGDEGLGGEHRGSLRFLLFGRLQHFSAAQASAWLAAQEGCSGEPAAAGVLDVAPSIDEPAFNRAIAEIHEAIRNGETYQVNYTYRLDFRAFGSPIALYRRLRARQPVAYGALIALPPGDGPRYVLSCSPELFLRHRAGRLMARPMKGTASRASIAESDSELARLFSQDDKNCAENLMIVDLLRNDLGRVAATGSVRVPALFTVEPYKTLFQMTSTIEAELPAATGFATLLRALFPCGSITGAPKHRTMQIIRRLETTPRGLYTGSVGWIDAPPAGAACGNFCLSVAIRTITLGEPQHGLWPGRMGIGAGITIDSDAAEEYRECVLKARFLSSSDPGFQLIETLSATRSGGVRYLERHLARLAVSASRLGFRCDRGHLRQILRSRARELPAHQTSVLRLVLHHGGRAEIEIKPLPPLPAGGEPVALRLSTARRGGGPLAFHKTSLRGDRDAARRQAAASGLFDILFANRGGLLTEGARSNVFLRLDGRWYTPPLELGLIPGVMRGVLLEDPQLAARERRLTLADLDRAEEIVVCNALYGALPARLVGECVCS